jgi:two-component system, NtrC family, response regulator PilR
VSVLTGFLTKVASSQYVLVEQQRRDILELSQRQRTLIDELPDGIITTDLNERIISLNQAAGNLLQLRKDVTGRPLAEVLKMLDPTFEVGETVASVPVPQREIELKKEDGSAGTNIVYQARSIATATGENNALIFVFQDITKLRSIEDQLAMQERMARLLAEKENRSLVSGTRLRDFVGESQLMQKVFNLIERVAPSDATVLVSGESGTGKELVARSIHLASQRCNGPFMAVNCGAIPENLIESELFGHKKGSFTGAEQDYAGIFRQADGGTLFLDEIGELPLQMQTKLLRTIQERTVRPIGGNKDIPISVRIIAATNRNLRKEVESGNFREDLFYRLNVINISLPALRQRKDDIPLLVNSILKGLVDRDVTPVVSPQAMSLLMNYDYPGNVRELENLLERAVVLGSEVILPEHLPETVTRFEGDGESKTLQETRIVIQDDINFPVELDKILADIERKYLEGALMRSNGAKKKAAQMLGINFRSFRYRLQKFGIAEEE